MINWEDAHLYPPDRMNIQLTNICNANCTFCGYQYLEDEKSFLSDEHFYAAVDQYLALGGQRLSLTPLVGDLLVDPKVFERLSYVTQKNIFKIVKFYTNGILLSRKEYPEKLLAARPTHVIFSLPGFDKDLYERVYRNKSYNRMIKGVSKFLKINNDAGSPIDVSFSLKPDISDDLAVYTDDYREYIKPFIGDDKLIFVRDLDSWGGSIKQSDLTGNMCLAKEIPADKKDYPCYFTFFLAILVDGHVRLCGCRFNNGTEYDGLVVGHLSESTLSEIWNSAKAQAVRKNFLKKDLEPVCQTCTHYAPYSGKERSSYTIKEFKNKISKL